MFTQAVAFSTLAAMVSSHVLISNPVPYGASTLDLIPLKIDGSDFPCKQRPGVYELEGASNVYPQGSTQQLSFTGTTVYGGGSCQISVTTDLQPNKDSIWKVIKSIEGGCPARNVTGNLVGDLMDPSPDTYDFTIPADLPAGDYSLAWTWFNKVGNREMYMNCAPVTVTGSAGNDALLSTFPDMFVANAGNGCITTESTDVQFPEPGDDVSRENIATDVFAAPVGTCPTGASQMPPVDPTPVASPLPTGIPSNGSTPIETPIVSTSLIFSSVHPTPIMSSTTLQSSILSTPVLSSTPVQATPSATPSSTPLPGTPAVVLTGECFSEGLWNCIDGFSFQRCASGVWSVVQPLAAGTSCNRGQRMDFELLPIAQKRAFMHRSHRLMA